VEQRNRLGIHLSADRAVAVVASVDDQALRAAFMVRCDDEHPASLGEQIARELAARNLSCAETFVALDATLTTHHRVRSEFTDFKQIQATIRFDVEEVLATDVSGLAIASCVVDHDENGSALAVFSTDKTLLSAFLGDLQAHDLDPTVIEPDAVCLARLTERITEPPAETTLFVFPAEHTCTMIGPSHADGMPAVRSFLWSRNQDRTSVLAREIPLTQAAWNGKHPVEHVALVGAIERIDTKHLAETIHRPVHTVSLDALLPTLETPDGTLPRPNLSAGTASEGAGASHIDSAPPPGEPAGPSLEPACLLAAWAAAPAPRQRQADLRADFAPFIGKRIIIQRYLRIAAVALTILFSLLALDFHSRAGTYKRYSAELWSKLESEYTQAMMGTKPKDRAPHRALDRVIRGMKQDSRNVGPEDSVPARLTFVLEAVNQAMGVAEDGKNPNAIDLQIERISLTTRTINITGSTKGPDQTLTLLNALNAHPRLTKTSENTYPDGPRGGFTVTLELKKGS